MADEALFLLLHNEMVSGVYKSAEQGEVENGRCITKLENMGFRVGQGLIERFTKDTARFKDELDIMKFICKDFWTTVFKKQIDNLRTNHQGIYVLQDNKFRLLTQLSAGKQYLEHASKIKAGQGITTGNTGGLQESKVDFLGLLVAGSSAGERKVTSSLLTAEEVLMGRWGMWKVAKIIYSFKGSSLN
ncbi:trafficking protein particle complex subunit 6B isoform X1 [Nannospalax galili]|uniref:trafficking protein particle complex subunit 6B isoform X1 n=1 Tax=Nannospalax galili TaxID=1026970 RepID=UPI00111C56FA|nr:trafficking protein particle complex subunit 6B isoform X1 [Nannospalax galili]